MKLKPEYSKINWELIGTLMQDFNVFWWVCFIHICIHKAKEKIARI
jgi:hypothetical protein